MPRFAWSVWGYLLAIAVVAFGAAVLSTITVGRSTGPETAWLIRCVLIMCCVIAVTHVYLRHDRLAWRCYGVRFDSRSATSCLVGFLSGIALALLWTLVVWLWAPFDLQLNPSMRCEALFSGVAAAIALGIAEEVGYRSYALERLDAQYGAIVGVLAPTAIFVLSHLSSGMPWKAAVLVVGTCSVLYGSLMLWTRSLPLVAAFHVANNVGQDALLRTSSGSLWLPVFADVDAAKMHQLGIWTSMAALNLFLAICIWTLWVRRPPGGPGSRRHRATS